MMIRLIMNIKEGVSFIFKKPLLMTNMHVEKY